MREIGRFTCAGADGRRYVVIEYQHMMDATTIRGGQQFMPGIKELQLTDGRSVNMNDDDTFEIVQTGEVIRRV